DRVHLRLAVWIERGPLQRVHELVVEIEFALLREEKLDVIIDAAFSLAGSLQSRVSRDDLVVKTDQPRIDPARFRPNRDREIDLVMRGESQHTEEYEGRGSISRINGELF